MGEELKGGKRRGYIKSLYGGDNTDGKASHEFPFGRIRKAYFPADVVQAWIINHSVMQLCGPALANLDIASARHKQACWGHNASGGENTAKRGSKPAGITFLSVPAAH